MSYTLMKYVDRFSHLKGKLKNRDVYLTLLFSLSLFSIFLTNTFIYPVFFVSFIISTIYFSIKDSRKEVLLKVNNVNNWVIYGLIFVLWTFTVSLFNLETIDIKNFVKLIINLSFLLIIPYYRKIAKKINILMIFKLLEIIIIINFLQLLLLYIKLDLFSYILTEGISTSQSAYMLTSEPSFIFFGSLSKNIWATKIIFVQLIYILGIRLELYQPSRKNVYYMLTIVILNTLLGLGRTAQLAFMISLVYVSLRKIYHYNIIQKKHLFLLGLFSLLLAPILFKFVFHIQFNINDGGFLRLIYWKAFIMNFWKENFIFGNGILSARYFLPKYAQHYIGENNMHNVFFNTLLDWGIIGGALYILFLFNLLNKVKQKIGRLDWIFMVILPLLFITGLQYLGYDNDIVIFLSLVLILAEEIENKKMDEKKDGGMGFESFYLNTNL